MAYLKQASYRQCVEDADKAIELKPGYLKAHHRRGKAYAALNEHENAIKDFQYILEEEPENKEVNRDLMDARIKVKGAAEKGTKDSKDKGGSSGEAKTKKSDEKDGKNQKNKFVRVAIEEDSDEEEEEDEANGGDKGDDDEPRIEDVSPNKGKSKDTTVIKSKPKPAASAKGGFVSKFPLKGARAIEEHTREAKRLMKQGGDDFLKKYEAHQKGEPEPTPSPQDEAKKKKEEADKKEAERKAEEKKKE